MAATTTKIILIPGRQDFQCRVDNTVESVVNFIRSSYGLQFGYLKDHFGACMNVNQLIKDTVGDLRFLEGQPIQNVVLPGK
jgi:hypothetical protein